MPITILTDKTLEEEVLEKLVTNEFLKKESPSVVKKVEKQDIKSLIHRLSKKWSIPKQSVTGKLPKILYDNKGRYNQEKNILTSQHTMSGNVEEVSHFLRALRGGYIGKTINEEELLITELFAELSRQALRLPLIGEKLENSIFKYLRSYKSDNPERTEKDHQNNEKFLLDFMDHRLQILPYVVNMLGVNMYKELIDRDPQIMAKDPKTVYKLAGDIFNEAYRKFTEDPIIREVYEEVTGSKLPKGGSGLMKTDLSKIMI